MRMSILVRQPLVKRRVDEEEMVVDNESLKGPEIYGRPRYRHEQLQADVRRRQEGRGEHHIRSRHH